MEKPEFGSENGFLDIRYESLIIVIIRNVN